MKAGELFNTLTRAGATFGRHSGGKGLAIAMPPGVRDKYAPEIAEHIDDLIALVAERDACPRDVWDDALRTMRGSIPYGEDRI